MARKFQGYARGRDFSARDAGSAAVNRIQEQGNKVTSGLKQQLSRKRQIDQQYVSDLDSNFQRDQAIKQEIKTFEDKAFALKQQNLQQNQQQSLENIRVEGENAARLYKQLSEFSSTLGNAAAATVNAIDDAKNKAEVSTNLLYLNVDPPTQLEKDSKKQLFKANATTESSIQNSVTRDGLPQSTAQAQKASSPYLQVTRLDARLALAEQAMRSEATHDNYGIEFVHEILDRFSLFDVRPSRLYGLATAYSKIKSGYDSDNRRISAINQSTQLVNEAEAQFLNNFSEETALNYYQTLTTSTTDGRTAISRPDVLTTWFKSAENLALTNEQVETLMDLELIDENGNGLGETFRDRFGNTRYQTLINNREKARIEGVTQRSNVVKAEQLDNYNKTRDEIIKLGEQGNIDFETYKPMLDDLDVSSDQRNKLNEELYAISNDKVSNDALIAQADYMISTGQDISDVARQMTGKARSKYLDLGNKQKVAKTQAGIDDKAIRRTVKSALIKALGQQNVGDDKDPTLELALEDALIDIGKDTALNAANASLANSSKAALQLKLQEITSNSGKYEVKGIGKGNSNSTGNFFSYFTPEGKYFTEVVKANASEAIRAVRNRPESRKDVFLVTTDDLATVYNSVLNKEGYQLPYALKELQKAYPDTLQLQLNKYADEFGKPRITVPLTYQQVLSSRQDDKRAQRFMQQVETIQEERIIPIVADPSARSHPRFKTEAVNQRISFMQVAPADGGLTGLTVQDYQELAYAVSAEAQRGSDDEFAVAASILNRLASGRYGSTVAEVIRAPGQYEAVYNGIARYEPALAQRLASPEGQRMIVAMLQNLQGRTDFKGQTQLGNRDASDPMFSDRGNFYHYAGQTAGSGVYQGPIDTSYERFIN